MAMLTIYTAQMAKWRQIKEDRRPFIFIDTTVKTGDKTFAPNWDMVMGVKNNTLAEEEYTRQYIDLMSASYAKSPDLWQQYIKDNNHLVLACYCQAGKFCHRHILAKMFRQLAMGQGFVVTEGGEL